MQVWKGKETAKGWKVMALLLLAMLLAACGSNGTAGSGTDLPNAGLEQGRETGEAEGHPAEQEEDGQPEEPERGKNTVYPLTVTDATGAEVTLEAAPMRIVSTSPSETEILFALGLGDRIVAVSDYDNYPAEALDKPKIGGTWDPSEEAIIAMEPDLVIGGISMKEDIAERLRSLGLVLYKLEPKTVEDTLDAILQLGVLTDTQEAAEQLAAAMREDIRRVTEAAAAIPEDERKKVYLEFAPGWTVGQGEYLDELIRMAGGINVAGDIEGWAMVNEEHIIQADPDVILFAKDLVDFETGKPLDRLIRERPGWEQVKAIRDQQMFPLEEDIISRTGPRITQALLQVAEALYPGMVRP